MTGKAWKLPAAYRRPFGTGTPLRRFHCFCSGGIAQPVPRRPPAGARQRPKQERGSKDEIGDRDQGRTSFDAFRFRCTGGDGSREPCMK
mmetsp:Transcript_12741/g.34238  ORF Transcript_12741/g.34238 Transcript_12741/m.34238 type:complete len:89 (-) Transcript_12741:35-301(-)